MNFVHGDSDVDRMVRVTDPICVLSHLFLRDPEEVRCEKSSDANASGDIDISDPIAVLSFLFLGGDEPKPPFPNCGLELSPTPLTCGSFDWCQ